MQCPGPGPVRAQASAGPGSSRRSASASASSTAPSVTASSPSRDSSRLVHPLVRRLPETGRAYYWASAQHTARIQGLSTDESDAILGLIFRQQLKPEFVIRWNWTLGDIAFWDHRTTLHAGVHDYGRQPRRGRRANIGSAKPVPAV